MMSHCGNEKVVRAPFYDHLAQALCSRGFGDPLHEEQCRGLSGMTDARFAGNCCSKSPIGFAKIM